jgi:DNA modification methylase
MKIEERLISSILPYARNPRRNDQAINKVASSIKEFGFRQPIVVDKDGTVVAGHTRLEAAYKLGLKSVPVHVAEDLTEIQAKAYRIADNRVAQESEWDIDLLRLEMEELKDEIDLDLTGFDESELDKILVEAIEGLTDPDEVPQVDEDPVTEPGDLIELGRHRLICGDSRNIEVAEKLLDGSEADMVFTDPPYNIDYGNIKHPKFKVRNIENDNQSASDYSEFCRDFATVIMTFCNGCIYCFGPPGPDGRILFSALDQLFHCSTTIVWNKDNFTLGRGKYQNKYEPCWFGWNQSGSTFIDDRKLTNVWDFKRPKASDLHPTMKPVELVEYAIGHASNVNGTVFDPFGGSGSTMIASEKLSRKARLIELSPNYCDVIITRWSNFTGKDEVTINGKPVSWKKHQLEKAA